MSKTKGKPSSIPAPAKVGTGATLMHMHEGTRFGDEPVELAAALSFDALETAHCIVASGVDGVDEGDVGAIGFHLLKANMAHRRNLFMSEGDTVRDDTIERYLRIVENLGFECVHKDVLYDGDNESTYYIYAHRDGMLLDCSTYWDGTSVGSSHLNFQWKRTDHSFFELPVMGGGGFRVAEGLDVMTAPVEDLVWVGHHDGHEALARKVRLLREHGTLQPTWVPDNIRVLSLVHFLDEKETREGGRTRNEITAARFATLPDWVKEMVGDISPSPWTAMSPG